MTAYYNEIDPYAAQWLRNLIDAGHIAPGIVDERSIEDVRPVDLRGFTQCHFFAGIGVWSLALRRAGWADDRSIWTASCPCQPFSTAGEGAGFADERHLWPHLHHLIEQCRPPVIVGEQVASKDADPWVDLVQTDLEAVGYAFGAIAFPSAGVGGPHIRDRTYWVANADGWDTSAERQQRRGGQRQQPEDGGRRFLALGGLGHTNGLNARWHCGDGAGEEAPGGGCRALDGNLRLGADVAGAAGGLANANGERPPSDERAQSRICEGPHIIGASGVLADRPAGPTNGLWRDADWLLCRDGKWRPVEPGTFPLAHGASARVGRLRAYGNAINVEAACVWIETVMDCLPA